MFPFRGIKRDGYISPADLERSLNTLRTELERRVEVLERDSASFTVERNHLIGLLTSLEQRVRSQVHRLTKSPAEPNGGLDGALTRHKGY